MSSEGRRDQDVIVLSSDDEEEERIDVGVELVGNGGAEDVVTRRRSDEDEDDNQRVEAQSENEVGGENLQEEGAGILDEGTANDAVPQVEAPEGITLDDDEEEGQGAPGVPQNIAEPPNGDAFTQAVDEEPTRSPQSPADSVTILEVERVPVDLVTIDDGENEAQDERDVENGHEVGGGGDLQEEGTGVRDEGTANGAVPQVAEPEIITLDDDEEEGQGASGVPPNVAQRPNGDAITQAVDERLRKLEKETSDDSDDSDDSQGEAARIAHSARLMFACKSFRSYRRKPDSDEDEKGPEKRQKIA